MTSFTILEEHNDPYYHAVSLTSPRTSQGPEKPEEFSEISS
jgi:hypothetical protein